MLTICAGRWTQDGFLTGPAAAVADGYVPIALATQTGSPPSAMHLPEAFMEWNQRGGTISREGAKLYANSLDTIGFHTDSLDL